VGTYVQTEGDTQYALVRTISVHNAYIDCYNAVEFRRNLLLDSTASLAVDFKVSNGDCEHTYLLKRVN
jgi:hypothetical protein